MVQVLFLMPFSMDLEADESADYSESESVGAQPGSVVPELSEFPRRGAADELVASAGEDEEEFDEEDFDDDFDDDFEEELDEELNDDLDEFDEDIEQNEGAGDAGSEDGDDEEFGDEEF